MFHVEQKMVRMKIDGILDLPKDIQKNPER